MSATCPPCGSTLINGTCPSCWERPTAVSNLSAWLADRPAQIPAAAWLAALDSPRWRADSR